MASRPVPSNLPRNWKRFYDFLVVGFWHIRTISGRHFWHAITDRPIRQAFSYVLPYTNPVLVAGLNVQRQNTRV